MLKLKKPKSQSNTACICLWPCFILVPGAKPCTKFLTYTLDPHSLPKLHPGMAVCLLKPLFKFRSTFEAWNRNVGGENDDDDITEGVSVCTSQVQPKGTDHGTSLSNASAPYIRIICQGIRRVGIFAGMFMVGTTPSKGIWHVLIRPGWPGNPLDQVTLDILSAWQLNLILTRRARSQGPQQIQTTKAISLYWLVHSAAYIKRRGAKLGTIILVPI